MPSFIFLYILLKNLNFRKRMFSSCVIQILNHLKRRCNHFNFFMFFILCRVNIQIHFYANVRMSKYRLQQKFILVLVCIPYDSFYKPFLPLQCQCFFLLCRFSNIRLYHSITSITGIFHNHIILICIIKYIKQCYPLTRAISQLQDQCCAHNALYNFCFRCPCLVVNLPTQKPSGLRLIPTLSPFPFKSFPIVKAPFKKEP